VISAAEAGGLWVKERDALINASRWLMSSALWRFERFLVRSDVSDSP
jgi:hypothetical protein